MAVRVLGPIELDGDSSLSPRARTALCALVLRRPMAVSLDELADASWGPVPPSTWPKQLQATIGHLRKALPRDVVVTCPGGYRLDLPYGDVDVDAFDEGVARARAFAASGEPDRAVSAYSRSLALWRGDPFAELREWDGAASEVARLTELRSTCEEDLLDARLAAGEHRTVASDARKLLEQDPLRERRWAILALAQYRCGRQGDALLTLRDARRHLVRELGVDPGAQLTELEQQILHHDPSIAAIDPAPAGRQDCPYRGLAAFGVDDSETFHGRAAEIEACLTRLHAHPLLVIAGPSGVGKSSLARAGVAAALRRQGVPPVVVMPGPDPVGGLRAAIGGAPAGAALVVDQLEDLFIGGYRAGVVREFCRVLAEATDDHLVVVTVRADQIAGLSIDPRLAQLTETGLHLVRPLTDDQLREVIEEPARQAGLRLEHGLVELLVNEAGDGAGSLPLLSHALVETWRRRDGSVLTVDGYEASGGISAAVAQTAERVYEGYSEADRATCRALLLRLVTPSGEGGAIHRRQPLRALGLEGGRDRVMSDLVRARLLTADDGTIEIAHESLVRAWPRLRAWLDDDAAGVRILRHLSAAANGWDALGRPDGELYRGARLDVALEWRASTTPELTAVETDFLDAAQALREADADQLAVRAARDARQNRRLRTALASVVAVLVLAVVAGSLAGVSRADATRARNAAELQVLVNQSIALQATNRDAAALLAVEAYRRAPDDAHARSALLSTFTASPGFVGYHRVPGATRIAGASVPGTATSVVVVDARTPLLIGTDDGAVIRTFDPVATSDQGPRPLVRVSADGTRVAIQAGRSLTVDDIATGARLLGPLTTGPSGELALDPHGKVVVTVAGNDGSVTSRRVQDGVVLATAKGTAKAAAAFDGSGQLVVGSSDGPVRVLDPTSLATLRTIDPPAPSSELRTGGLEGALNQSPVDQHLPGRRAITDDHAVSAGDDLVVLVGGSSMLAVAPSTGGVVWTADLGGSDTCSWSTVAPEAGLVLCGDRFGVVRERSLTTGAENGVELDIQRGDVGNLSVSQGELVVFGAGAPVITRWMVDGSGPVTRLLARGSVAVAGYDPDGNLFLTASRPADAQSTADLTSYAVWDARTDTQVQALPGRVLGVEWMFRGIVTAYVQGLGDLRPIDVETGREVPGGLRVPERAGEIWSTPSGDRVYVSMPGWQLWVGNRATQKWDGHPIDGRNQGVIDMSATSDGSRVAIALQDGDPNQTSSLSADVGTTTVVQMYDGRTGKPLGTPRPGADAVALRDDGLLAVARRGSVSLVDSTTMTTLRDLPGARGAISNLQFSDDGTTLIAATDDQSVSVYDANAGIRLGEPIPSSTPRYREVSVPIGPELPYGTPVMYPGYLRPDGRAVLVTVAQGVAEWDLDPAHLSAAACAAAGRNLTQVEWATYASALGPYRQTCPTASS
ncbi:BTAD domain-containing putative transcriptional regulator [Cellulomonas sp. ICMP 17802]|uniref:nSTAND1 domain-containing NTPase n=1 Tax=Cellulomonas sp. ICMP 17802 TaxID=3239199 RepID=UPI00351B8999